MNGVEHFLPVQNELGETPIWVPEEKLLYWVDICIGLGGADLNELYITTAWYNLSGQQRKDQPLAGDLFRIQTDITGIAEPVFAG